MRQGLTVNEELAYSCGGADSDRHLVVREELDLLVVLHVLGEELDHLSAPRAQSAPGKVAHLGNLPLATHVPNATNDICAPQA